MTPVKITLSVAFQRLPSIQAHVVHGASYTFAFSFQVSTVSKIKLIFTGSLSSLPYLFFVPSPSLLDLLSHLIVEINI